MTARRNPVRTLGEHAIFGDEEAARLQAEVGELRALVVDLADRVQSQFTTISAHAEIARHQAEFVREEARADLERTRQLLIDLVERTRAEFATVLAGELSAPAAVPHGGVEAVRVEAVEQRLAEMVRTVDRCFDRQRVLADTIEALFDSVLAERRGEPVVGLSLV